MNEWLILYNSSSLRIFLQTEFIFAFRNNDLNNKKYSRDTGSNPAGCLITPREKGTARKHALRVNRGENRPWDLFLHSSFHLHGTCQSIYTPVDNLLFLLINIRRYEFLKDSWGFYEVPVVEPCVDAEMDAGDKQLFEHKPSDPFSFHFYEKNVTSEANKESTGTNPRFINTATLYYL